MTKTNTLYYQDIEKCVDEIIEKVGKKIVMAIPLALAKPNRLVNAIYNRIKNDDTLYLKLFSGVSLEKPEGKSELEKRFLEPFVERVWEDFEEFEYIKDLRRNTIPKNFKYVEFYNKTAAFLHCPYVQMNYMGSNYTHAVRDAFINECNVLAQLISKKDMNGETMYSMASNPDTHLEAAELVQKKRAQDENFKCVIVGQVHSKMPFMYGKAVVKPSHYDIIVENPEYDKKIFCAPKTSVSPVDWMIGIYASTLIKDGGTIQVGIGSLGDAVSASIMMRHKNNKEYKNFLKEADIETKYNEIIKEVGETGTFEEGLLCSSEMFVDSFLDLFKAGIIKKKVYEHLGLQTLINEKKIAEKFDNSILTVLSENKIIHTKIREKDFLVLQEFGILKSSLTYKDGKIYKDSKEYDTNLSDANSLELIIKECLGDSLKKGVVAYASFFIGQDSFYEGLRNLTEEERNLIDMRGVDYVNQIYGDEELKRAQRKYGRFINAALKSNIMGAITADALEDHRIISGPGGQYNFVSMAHALEDGRAITMIRSSRGVGKKAKSNIVWQYGHTTIPRHLRDIVITEYGIADLRGKQDKDVIAELLNITDSRFQEELLQKCKKFKKIPQDYKIPEQFKNNFPEVINKRIETFRKAGFFSPFPFGSDLTEEEKAIGKSLKNLKVKASESVIKLIANILKEFCAKTPNSSKQYLGRMKLSSPKSVKEKILQKVVVYALKDSGVI